MFSVFIVLCVGSFLLSLLCPCIYCLVYYYSVHRLVGCEVDGVCLIGLLKSINPLHDSDNAVNGIKYRKFTYYHKNSFQISGKIKGEKLNVVYKVISLLHPYFKVSFDVTNNIFKIYIFCCGGGNVSFFYISKYSWCFCLIKKLKTYSVIYEQEVHKIKKNTHAFSSYKIRIWANQSQFCCKELEVFAQTFHKESNYYENFKQTW